MEKKFLNPLKKSKKKKEKEKKRKGRGTRDQIANIRWIIGKPRELQKNIYFCFIDYAKAFTVWITRNCGKF